MPKHLLKVMLTIAVIIGISLCILFENYLSSELNISDSSLTFILKPGQSISHIAYDLNRKAVLDNPAWLTAYVSFNGDAGSIKAGEYQINKGDSVRTLLDKLLKGDVLNYSITIPEGWSFQQALELVLRQKKLAITLDNTKFEKIMSELGLADGHPEGRFFPDTYYYHLGMSDQDLLLQAYQRMQNVLAQEWQDRDLALPYKTPYEALIMASIVEKETGLAIERKEIAGVFVRRLQNNMRLQTDPTVIYGLGNNYKGNLSKTDIKNYSVYNTYRIHGLPPTPITLPGQAAIQAALHPATGNSLYFVAKGDGSHYFSATLEEHLQAVKKYQIKQRVKNYRSTPLSPQHSSVPASSIKISPLKPALMDTSEPSMQSDISQHPENKKETGL